MFTSLFRRKCWFLIIICTILSSPSPNPAQPRPSHTQIPISSKGTGADTKILWATTTPPPHPQLLSMKDASNKKTQRVKVT